jgi:hypothetical protein
MAEVKEKAARVRQLMRDETFNEVMQIVKSRQVGVFLDSSATIDDINQAHNIVKGLDKIEEYMKSVLADEAMYDKKHS